MTKVVIKAADGTGAVESYHNANKKLETTSAGVTVTGNIAVTGTVDGRDLATDGTKLDGIEASATADQTNAEIRAAVEAATDSNVFTDADHTKLNGISSSATSVGGATGVDFNDNVKVRFGTGNDLEVFHDGSDSTIDNNTGALYIKSNTSTQLLVNNTENAIIATANGAVELYYDNSLKISTLTDGAKTYGRHVIDGDLFLDNGDHAGKDIYWDSSEKFMRWEDDVEARFGDGGDLRIYHDGTDSFVKEATGDLWLQSTADDIIIRAADNIVLQPQAGEAGININGNGSVDLFYDNSKVFETASNGAKVLNPSGNGTLSIIGSEGNDAILQLKADDGDDAADHWRIVGDADGSLYIQNWTASAWETNIKGTGNGNVELYHNNSKKFETTANGCQLQDNSKLQLGAGPDLEIYSDGTNSFVQCPSTGNNLTVESDNHLYLKVADSDDAVKGVAGGQVELYYDGSKQCETNSGGLKWEDSKKAYFGTSNDLQIYHDASHSIIKATGSGALKLVTDHSLQVRKDDPDTGEYLLQAVPDGDVDLFYNGVNKLSTYASGCIISGNIKPSADNTHHCGVSSARWDNVYATNTTIQTSDRNEKNSIVESDLGLSFINKLKPVSYKWNNTKYHKTYYGLIAQDLEQTLATEGKTVNDFAGLDKPSDGPMGLGYTEFISPLIKAIQELSSEVETLKTEIQTLKGA